MDSAIFDGGTQTLSNRLQNWKPDHGPKMSRQSLNEPYRFDTFCIRFSPELIARPFSDGFTPVWNRSAGVRKFGLESPPPSLDRYSSLPVSNLLHGGNADGDEHDRHLRTTHKAVARLEVSRLLFSPVDDIERHSGYADLRTGTGSIRSHCTPLSGPRMPHSLFSRSRILRCETR